MLSTMTWVSLGVVSLLTSLCIMVAPFPVGDVLPGDGASSHGSRYSVGFGAVFACVDELEVALGFAHVVPFRCGYASTGCRMDFIIVSRTWSRLMPRLFALSTIHGLVSALSMSLVMQPSV